jgi:hypothetical protein
MAGDTLCGTVNHLAQDWEIGKQRRKPPRHNVTIGLLLFATRGEVFRNMQRDRCVPWPRSQRACGHTSAEVGPCVLHRQVLLLLAPLIRRCALNGLNQLSAGAGYLAHF